MNHFPTKIIKIEFPPSAVSYDVLVGASLLGDIGALIRGRFGERRCIIVTDRQVSSLYQQRIEAVLAASGHNLLPTIVVPQGETSKDFATLWVVLEQILAQGIDRETIIISLGGGVISDLAGLAGSLALRGLKVVHIPTTLTAQVDSALGGKTGINSAYGKNTIGTFYHPSLVVADVTALDSVSHRDMLAGYAEILKYGLILDKEFFIWCRKHGSKLLRGDRDAQIYAISTSNQLKSVLVIKDEKELADRALLSFGHNFGHALEVLTGFGPALLHGEAVAIGMCMATKLSVDLGLCPRDDLRQMEDHFEEVGLPIAPPKFAYDVDRLMNFMQRDKRDINGDKLTLIMTRGIGKAFINRDVNMSPVKALWKSYISRSS